MTSPAKPAAHADRLARVEAHIRAALALSPNLTKRARDEVVHFIDHDEYGLALATLLDAAVEEEVSIDPAAGTEIDQAAVLMRAPTGLWRLPARGLYARLRESGLT